jgi:hypothetical protein
MKKNIFNFFVVLLALCCLFVGCDNPAKNGEKNEWEPTGPAVANWFEYTTSTPTGDGWYTEQTSIFYINTDGKIERAGSESYEYFGTELEMLQNQLSWSICRKNATYDVHVSFKVSEPPVWADNTSDDNSNNDIENEDGNNNNPSGGDNNNNNENDIPTEDDEPELTLPSGYEWWCFEKAYLDNGNYVSVYNYYEGDTCTRTGIPSKELTNDSKNSFYLNISKTSAISNYAGNCYQVTNLSTLPSWCY